MEEELFLHIHSGPVWASAALHGGGLAQGYTTRQLSCLALHPHCLPCGHLDSRPTSPPRLAWPPWGRVCLLVRPSQLSVSPGAVAVGRQERVSLILVWDLSDGPSLSRAQALVSPVVACGPHGASFLKPCTLTFKHCAQMPSHARTYSSNTNLLDAKDWKPLGKSGVHTSLDECRIQLSHFRWAPAPWPLLSVPLFCPPHPAWICPFISARWPANPLFPRVPSWSLCPNV